MSNGGFSKVRLGRLHDVMAGHVERGEVPGLVALVSRRGDVHVDAIGAKAIGGGDPMRRDTIFRIASMTKPVTAAATMMLVEECKLRLDEPVDRLLPELADRRVLRRLDGPLDDTVPANRPIGARPADLFHGLRHHHGTAGNLSHPKGDQRAAPRPRTAAAVDSAGARRMDAPLGKLAADASAWRVVDVSHRSDVPGVLIARASGRPLEAFLRERLFEPLGMKDTGFSVPAAKLDRLATSYWTNFETGAFELYDAAEGGECSRAPAFPSGGGGLVSTVDDFLAFGQMMLNRGRHGSTRLLSRPSVETMTTDQLTPAQKAESGLIPGYWDSHGWGFGVSVVTKRGVFEGSVGRFGWDGGLGTSWSSDPREEMVGILLTQRAWTSPRPPAVCADFWTSAYQAIDD
jgi:CubicO group peptidase (beta-lactamase class C family)